MNVLGRLQLITGCMRSQKSTELIRRIRLYQTFTKHILIINSIVDTRSQDNSIETRDKQTMTAIKLKFINDIFVLHDYATYGVIAIDEAQFFTDLYDGVIRLLNTTNAIIIIAGLDGTSDQEMFGQILYLQPQADHVVKLHAICQICNDGTLAPYTICTQHKNSDVLVGDLPYLSVCHKHINEYIPHHILITSIGNDGCGNLDSSKLSQTNPHHINMDLMKISPRDNYHKIYLYSMVDDAMAELIDIVPEILNKSYFSYIGDIDGKYNVIFHNNNIHTQIRNLTLQDVQLIEKYLTLSEKI